MAGTSDKVFLRAFKWFTAAVDQLEAGIPPGGAIDLSGTLTDMLRTKLGLELDKTAATIDPSGFSATRAEAQSLAIAAMVTGETLAALRLLGEILADIGAGTVGLDDLSKIIQQIERITDADPGKPPSAYSIAKLLLILSGDADEPESKPPARKLILLLTNNPGAERRTGRRAADDPRPGDHGRRHDPGPLVRGSAGCQPPCRRCRSTLPPVDQHKAFSLARSDDGSKKLDLTLGVSTLGPQPKLFAELSSTLSTQAVRRRRLPTRSSRPARAFAPSSACRRWCRCRPRFRAPTSAATSTSASRFGRKSSATAARARRGGRHALLDRRALGRHPAEERRAAGRVRSEGQQAGAEDRRRRAAWRRDRRRHRGRADLRADRRCRRPAPEGRHRAQGDDSAREDPEQPGPDPVPLLSS